jgi:hypothetical protein
MNFYNFDNNTEENFYDKNYSEIENTSEIVNDVLKNNEGTNLTDNKKLKCLTHKDCVLIYLNPNITSKNKYTNAMKHIKHCSTCQNEITKNNINDNSSLNSSNSILKKSEKVIKPEKVIENYSIPEKKIIINKNDEYKKMIQDEKNLKYQNLMLETSMSKYLENIDERKKLNDNINKILSLLAENNTKINNNQIKGYSDNTFLYVCLFVVIILLVIDIVLKIKN